MTHTEAGRVIRSADQLSALLGVAGRARDGAAIGNPLVVCEVIEAGRPIRSCDPEEVYERDHRHRREDDLPHQ
jgi:hypothetical protein